MFKFFRKYNKIILVVGAAFLMVAFLIQGTISMFYGAPGAGSPGTVNGETLSREELETARSEVQVLGHLASDTPSAGFIAQKVSQISAAGEDGSAGLKWALMLREARQLGLSASQTEARQMLVNFGVTQEAVTRIANELQTSPEFIYQAVRHWLMLEQYQALVRGKMYLDPAEGRRSLFQAISGDRQLQMRFLQAQMQNRPLPSILMEQTSGSARTSDQLVRWFVNTRQATVAGRALIIDAQAVYDEIETPSEEAQQSLFMQYRENLPGESEPYGFGYKYPDRVKVEWLAFPIEPVQDYIFIPDSEALAHYDDNKESYRRPVRTQPDTQPATQPATQPRTVIPPFAEVRGQIKDQLSRRKARLLADEIVRETRGVLSESTSLADAVEQMKQDYLDDAQDDTLREDFSLVKEDLVDLFAENWPGVETRTQQWVPVGDLHELPGIGRSRLSAGRGQPFRTYVRSVPELEPAPDHPLIDLDLQVQTPSRTLTGPDEARYVFRVTAAQQSHVPAPEARQNNEQLRDKVMQDARRLAAYELLREQQDDWLERAVIEGFNTIDQHDYVRLQPIRPTPRRAPNNAGALVVPNLPAPINRNATLIDTMFEIAETTSDGGERPVSEAPASERTRALPLDHAQRLCIYQVERYQPITRDMYQQDAESASTAMWLTAMLMPSTADTPALSFEALASRIGFERSEPQQAEEEDDSPREQQRPGTL